mgnify:CR=1 FL=1
MAPAKTIKLAGGREERNRQPMRDEILAYKRERILQEAVKLFYERGFTGTTLDDIAAALGVTKPFIYTHFRSKVDLLAALCTPTIEMALAGEPPPLLPKENGSRRCERVFCWS